MSRSMVFIHAFPLDGGMWSAQVEALRALGWSALAPDLPGFGRAPLVEPDLRAYARAVLAECDRHGIERAVFAGLSMGGYVLFRVVDLAPERVAAVVLADTRAVPDSEDGKVRRTRLAERVRAEGTRFLADEILPVLLGETTCRIRPDLSTRVREKVLAANPEGVARALLAMRDRPDSTELLRSIRVPALVLVGEEDVLTPPEEAKALASGLPEAQLQVIPDAGHLSNLENPEAFNRALADFATVLHRGSGRSAHETARETRAR